MLLIKKKKTKKKKPIDMSSFDEQIDVSNVVYHVSCKG